MAQVSALRRARHWYCPGLLLLLLTCFLVGCSNAQPAPTGPVSTPTAANPAPSSTQTAASAPAPQPTIVQAVGAENQYADVIKQIGGDYVSVTAVMSDPAIDPHTYETSTADADRIGKATLVVQNGLGYDDFMTKLEGGSPNAKRTVIEVASALGYPADTPNPHLWYLPETMPKVAKLIADELTKQTPAQAAYFQANLKKFVDSMQPWNQALADLKQQYANSPVAVTELVGDYLLQAASLDIKTPWEYQMATQSGTDPSPQLLQQQNDLLTKKQVRVLFYNQQVVSDSTTAFLQSAKQNNIPVVGAYETMPTGYNYQTWMLAETKALLNALKTGQSTEKLN